MKLKNFDLSGEIELQCGNLAWDIHNFAVFEGLELVPASNAAVMKWTVPQRVNPWGCLENKFSGMNLYFEHLQFLTLTPRDADIPLTEDICVSAILKIDRNIQPSESRMHSHSTRESGESFRLAIHFQSGRVIEIESETVELIPVP